MANIIQETPGHTMWLQSIVWEWESMYMAPAIDLSVCE